MSYEALVYNVMIASPQDVVQERRIATDVIHEWNSVNSFQRKIFLAALAWETHATPTMGDRPQAIINRQLVEHCDLLVGIFWTRIGTPTGQAESGTVEEIRKHVSSGKPTMLYFSSAPVRLDSVDGEQYEQLQEFKKDCKSKGLIQCYESPNEFESKFFHQLSLKMNQEEYFKGYANLDGNTPGAGDITGRLLPDHQGGGIPILTEEARALLVEAAKDPQGIVMMLRTSSGLLVSTNRKNFGEKKNPRSDAKWQASVTELSNNGFLQDSEHKGEVFSVTHEGYRVADLLRDKE